MTEKVSALYQQPLPEELYLRLGEALAGKQVQVFFRADDIGKMDAAFIRMMELFGQYQMPLCLAVVPMWMNKERRQAMGRFSPDDPLWCWHQHGYAHINHEAGGKKNEFGESRPEGDVRRDLVSGRQCLENVLGSAFCPVFTPPWNRCSPVALQLLSELGFKAVSRSGGVQPQADLPDLYVNVDLHTGKETALSTAMELLLADWKRGVEQGRLGIMLHHQRMNEHSFFLLEQLFKILQSREGIALRTFRKLL
ncbi:MAG: polysaccharide deacetylase family protein [Desulfobulbaceae bacterium]|nr:polysaccharide deacetylase family protein [Desulfobulbaceae bacterium]